MHAGQIAELADVELQNLRLAAPERRAMIEKRLIETIHLTTSGWRRGKSQLPSSTTWIAIDWQHSVFLRLCGGSVAYFDGGFDP